MRGPLIVQDMVGLFRQEHRLLDEHAPQLCLHAEEKVLDKIFLDVQVLVEQLAQVFLVDVSPGAHEGELEESDHGRRQHELPDAVMIRIHQQPFLAQVIQQLFRFSFRGPPDLRRLFQGEGADGQHRHPLRFFLRKQKIQYLRESLRGRSSLGEPVDPVLKVFVSVS